ncbi:MAG TPA: ATP-binding protein [Caulobacteraceae bacterium]|jgi:two-component system phosphate regulon sensor histidine kinase PhoR
MLRRWFRRRRPAEAASAAQAAAAGPGETLDHRVLDAAPIPIMLVASPSGDPQAARLLIANLAARQVFRIGEAGGLLSAALRHPGALEAVETALGGASAEAALPVPGAAERLWRVIANPLRLERPGLDHALVLLRDETDLRRVERMRVDFLANASHELRTPLASLAGFIETLRGPAREDAAARERFLEIMSAQAGRMARLISDLLSLSRIELNEHIAPEGSVDLAGVVRDVLDAASPPPGAALPKVEVDLPPPGAALVRGDRDQLIQVTQNLIDNAVKYARPQGRVRIVVRASTGAAPESLLSPGAARLPLLEPPRGAGGDRAVLIVADDGPGIAREHLPRLSERFYRVEGQKSGERLGTGLGLAIVKHILGRHRGGLVVESAPGVGTAFHASVPLARPDGEGSGPS